MWLIAMKGFAGSGKSTLGRALSREFGWPLVDKDDVKDLLDSHVGVCQEVCVNRN
jgi:shikimate kinase